MVVNWPEQLEPDQVPDPQTLYPDIFGPNLSQFRRVLGASQVVFLRPLIQSPLTEVGEYTYFADPSNVQGFERENILFHYGPGRLVIGRYCAIARDVRFIMAAAQHRRGLTTYPFPMFGGAWRPAPDSIGSSGLAGAKEPGATDLRIGNDVWVGTGATLLAGITIGDGAVIGAGSVVSSDVAPYTVVAGNPARQVRQRLSDADSRLMRQLSWWDWSTELVTACLPELMGDDVTALAQAYARATDSEPDEAEVPRR